MLDMISVFSYAARYSAFNPVEHLWSPLSNHLSGVAFSPCIKGESKAPSQLSSLSDGEVKVRKQFLTRLWRVLINTGRTFVKKERKFHG